MTNFARSILISLTSFHFSNADAATLSGIVTANGRPVDSAIVTIYIKKPGARQYVTITNSSGSYRFTNVLNGDHILIVEKSGQRLYQGIKNVQATSDTFNINL